MKNNRREYQHFLNIHEPNAIKYRVDKERCMKWGIVTTDLIGFNYKYDESYWQGETDIPEINVVFRIPLPLGNWSILETEEFDTVTLRRIDE